ncbi:MAG: nucleoside/nucleotide kinase family protein [Phycisphaeraceae bacterium]|nr:nucleoside/nucleotide kinase family protein [Phycisphaeraceae bacterium]
MRSGILVPRGGRIRNQEPQIIDIRALAEDLIRRAAAAPRTIVGIAGIPGAGKSTLGRDLLDAIETIDPGVPVLVPMDGFHLTSERLERLGLRDRKGAPHTFDADGYVELLRKARDPRITLRFPVYDRQLHEPVFDDAEAHVITPAARIVLTEGNYLLLDTEPWSRLADVLDASWLLDTPVDKARGWTIERHVRGGRDRADAEAHYERSDALNVRLVLDRMRLPDLRLKWNE